MVYFLDEPGRQKLRNLLTDGPTLLLVEAAQTLLYRLGARPDLQGVLGDFSQNVWPVQGSPRKNVSIGAEQVDERAFLFRGKHGANVHHFALGATRVYEDLLGALHRLERPGRPLGVGRFFGNLLPDGRKLLGGDDCHGVATTLDLALVGSLEGGADSDDPMGAKHVQLKVCIVEDGHELCVAWTS